MEECRSDRSIAQCGAAGGEIRRGGVAHALTPSRDTHHLLQLKNASERERERERKNTAQYNTIQQSLTRSASEMASGVELPVPHIAFPASLEAILLEIDGIACHAAFHPEASHKSRNVREHGCKVPPHLSHRSIFEDM